MALEETLRSVLETHPRGKNLQFSILEISSGMGFAACGEQGPGISLVSAALPLEMEEF